jgi:hypothetical protein
MELAEKKRCGDHLAEQIWRIESDPPDISPLLQQIFAAEKKHRQEIKDMMVRSDAFAQSLA